MFNPCKQANTGHYQKLSDNVGVEWRVEAFFSSLLHLVIETDIIKKIHTYVATVTAHQHIFG